ncbi:MAG: hypothetical protein HDR88_18485 [Bacteroides sp.]|nr:hypothetical protein [Bacteroides sp.]
MKILLSGLLMLVSGSLIAQAAAEPLILEEFYGQKISPNGKYIYSDTGQGEVLIYNLETNEWNAFYGTALGNGNSLINDGTGVGTSGGRGAIIKGSETLTPSAFSRYPYSNIHGVTYDCTRITGVVGNPYSGGSTDENNQMYLPFVADIDADGNCNDLTLLPYPDKDFFGLTPQYCSATWISRDGKTILGQLIDYSGMFLQPIVYREDEAGEWSYSLPTQSIFNPEHIEIPPYPGEFDYSREPDPLDYMSDEQREEYLEDYDWWTTEGRFDQDLYPEPTNYMTEENAEEYSELFNAYVDYINEYNSQISDYLNARDAIFVTSISFEQAAIAMNTEGTIAALTSKKAVRSGYGPGEKYDTCILDLTDDSISFIDTKYDNIFAEQVLKDGIILGSTPTAAYVASYVYVPGSADYIPVEDYIAAHNPEAASWMQDNLVHELYVDNGVEPYMDNDVNPYDVGTSMEMLSGLGAASEDFSVFAGSVTAYMYHETLYYLTYVFTDLETSSIKRVSIDDNDAVKVMPDGVIDIAGEVADLSIFDLSGRKVLSMPRAEGQVSTGLTRGIYVVSYFDVNGQQVSQKIKF